MTEILSTGVKPWGSVRPRRPSGHSTTPDVFREVALASATLDAKYGREDLPDSVGGDLLGRASHHGVYVASLARFVVERAEFNGSLTWADLLTEEVARVVGVADDAVALREELVEAAALCVAWIEAIDRREDETV